MMRVIFRCDVSPQLGSGHLMRCRALAHGFTQVGAQCIMVGPGLDYRNTSDAKVFCDWVPRPGWGSSRDEAEFLVALAARNSRNVIVLDDYRIDETYAQVLLRADLKWLQFDGRFDRPLWADWVLNANPSVREVDYKGLLQKPGARALLGSRYAPLRPEFVSVAKRKVKKTPITDVLSTFGGGDDRGAILFVLKALLPRASETIHFHVVSGATNPRNDEIEQWVANNAADRVKLYINPAQMAPIFCACDLAIMAGGSSTYEAAACGLPMLLISLAQNQEAQSLGWQQKGASIYLGGQSEVSAEQLVSHFGELISDSKKRNQMAVRGQLEVDGKGAARTADELVQNV